MTKPMNEHSLEQEPGLKTDQTTETNTMAEEQAQTVQQEAVEQEATPEGNKADWEALQAELEAARQQAQTNLDGWQRARAEFTNYKRRTAKELSDSHTNGVLDALASVLPIMDDFERALENIPEEWQGHPWMNGTALILKNMQKVMDQYKVEKIDPVGEEFNPNLHQAIGMEDSDEYDSGIVTATLQKGYRSGDRILRPALVRVAN